MPDQLPTVSIGTVIFFPLRLRAAQRAAVEIVAQPEMQRVGLPGVRNVPGSAADHVVHQGAR